MKAVESELGALKKPPQPPGPDSMHTSIRTTLDRLSFQSGVGSSILCSTDVFLAAALSQPCPSCGSTSRDTQNAKANTNGFSLTVSIACLTCDKTARHVNLPEGYPPHTHTHTDKTSNNSFLIWKTLVIII
jgi:hypothetical protein